MQFSFLGQGEYTYFAGSSPEWDNQFEGQSDYDNSNLQLQPNLPNLLSLYGN